MDLTLITAEKVVTCYRKKSFLFHIDPEHLNVFGVRATDMTPNIFNDAVGAFCQSDVGLIFRVFGATTDPGIFYLENPVMAEGTGILAEGQYLGSHRIGKHKGQYDALVQISKMRLYRDKNRDDRFDLDPITINEGIFGIDIHRANPDQQSTIVDRWSAGCQVIADPKHFDELMVLAKASANRHGNLFDYTLFNEKDFL